MGLEKYNLIMRSLMAAVEGQLSFDPDTAQLQEASGSAGMQVFQPSLVSAVISK